MKAALEIVTGAGLDDLTLERVADLADVPLGALQREFASAKALLAELERQAIDRLVSSYLAGREALERSFSDEPNQVRALARLIAFGEFWRSIDDTLPAEARLVQLLLAEPTTVVPAAEASRALPSVLRLLDLLRACLDDAVAVGALTPADGFERAVLLAACMFGIRQAKKLASWDDDLFGSERLARTLVVDLLRGWGAGSEWLDAATRRVESVPGDLPFAPPDVA